MHIEKIGQFLEVWVFPETNAGLCVHGPHKTAGHLQNTPGTPAMHFPLVVAGSQSALYQVMELVDRERGKYEREVTKLLRIQLEEQSRPYNEKNPKDQMSKTYECEDTHKDILGESLDRETLQGGLGAGSK